MKQERASNSWKGRAVGLSSNDGGLAMFSVILLTLGMLSLGIVGVRAAGIGLRISENDLRARKALAVAEAGLDHALGVLSADLALNGFNDGFGDELGAGGVGGSLAAIGSVQSLYDVGTRFRSFGGGENDGYYVRVDDNYDEQGGADDPTADADLVVRVRSAGRVRGAERVVEATVRMPGLFSWALFGDDWVEFRGTGDTDSYDSRVGPYPNGPGDNGDVGSNGDINIKSGGADVFGDAAAQGEVIDKHGGIHGSSASGAPPVFLPPVPDCGPPYSSGAGISGGSYDPATGVLTGKNNSIITLAPGSYCFDTLDIRGDLIVSGQTVISVTNEFDLSSGAMLNPGNPPDLQVFSSSHDVDKGVKLNGGPGAKAAIYAPHTAIEITGGADIWGSLVGKTVSMHGNGGFHYDEALGLVAARGLELLRWREVRGR